MRVLHLARFHLRHRRRCNGRTDASGVRIHGRPSCCDLEFREPEVEQFGAASGEHDVCGLQVAMDDPLAMGVVERAGNLLRVRQCLVDRELAFAQAGCQRRPFEMLHDQKIDLVMASDVVQRADVRMCQSGHRLGFACKTCTDLRIRSDSAKQNLDCHATIEARVSRGKHFSHTASTEKPFDTVRA